MFEHLNQEDRRILVVQEDFVDEMTIALETNGGPSAISMDITDQTISILKGSNIGAAIFDRHLDPDKAVQIADALVSLGIPFVFANAEETASLPERLMAFSMTESSPELQLIAHQLFGRPTYH